MTYIPLKMRVQSSAAVPLDSVFTGPMSSYLHALDYTKCKNIAFEFRFAGATHSHCLSLQLGSLQANGRDHHVG